MDNKDDNNVVRRDWNDSKVQSQRQEVHFAGLRTRQKPIHDKMNTKANVDTDTDRYSSMEQFPFVSRCPLLRWWRMFPVDAHGPLCFP